MSLIVADSGSTDDTLNLCRRYDARLVYVPPGNMYRAINEGLRLATTHWLTYLNSDDTVYPYSYARLMKLGVDTESEVVYGSCDFVDWEGRFIHSYTPGLPDEILQQFLQSQLSLAQPASIFTQKLFDELGGFNEQYVLASDLDFFLRAALERRHFSMMSGETVACFRLHRNQSSQNTQRMMGEIADIQERFASSRRTFTLDTLKWRSRNLPNYVVRILRYWCLTGHLRLVKTMDPGGEPH